MPERTDCGEGPPPNHAPAILSDKPCEVIRRLVVISLMAACGCAGSEPAPGAPASMEAKVPFTIKGDRVGVLTLDQFLKKYAADGCVPQDVSDNFGWIKGSKRMTVASLLGRDAPVTFANHQCLTIVYLFYDGLLESITVAPSSRVSDLFRHALTSQYGQPTRGTGHLGKPTDSWSSGTTRLTLDVETGVVVVVDQAVEERRMASSMEAAKKDL